MAPVRRVPQASSRPPRSPAHRRAGILMRRPSITAVHQVDERGARRPGEPPATTGGFCFVAFDTGRRLRVTTGEVARYGLVVGETVSPELVARLAARDAYHRARSRALRLLAIRPRSIEEIRANLRRQRVSQRTIRAVIADLTAAGYLNDLAFARFWTVQRIAARRYGPRRLGWELRAKGVPADAAAQALAEAACGDQSAPAEEDAAVSLVRRRLAAEPRPPSHRQLRRLAAMLERRGFSAEAIARALRTTSREMPLEPVDG